MEEVCLVVLCWPTCTTNLGSQVSRSENELNLDSNWSLGLVRVGPPTIGTRGDTCATWESSRVECAAESCVHELKVVRTLYNRLLCSSYRYSVWIFINVNAACSLSMRMSTFGSKQNQRTVVKATVDRCALWAMHLGVREVNVHVQERVNVYSLYYIISTCPVKQNAPLHPRALYSVLKCASNSRLSVFASLSIYLYYGRTKRQHQSPRNAEELRAQLPNKQLLDFELACRESST